MNVETDTFITAIVHARVGTNLFETAEGILPIHHACLADGEVCDADGQGYEAKQFCCAKGLYCPGAASSKAPQMCAPLK